MEEYMNWINKNKKKFWFALLLNIVLLLLLLLFFRPKYETNDDMGILCMVSGVKLGADAHLVYMNYVLGKILVWCYQMAGGVPWYALIQYSALLMAFTAITYVCLNRIESRNVIWILAAVLTAFSYEAYIRIQYTKTAGILSVAGLFLFCYAVISEEKYKRRLLGSILLCALGFMYRNVQFFAEAALMSAAGIPVLFSCSRQLKKKKNTILVHGLAGCAILAVVLGGLFAADKLAYRLEVWQDYLAYNTARTELYDYGFPDYESHKETYNALQIDENAFKLYKQWNHGDSEKMSAEVMESIASAKPEKSVNKKLISGYLHLFPVKFFTIAVFHIFLMVFLYSFLTGTFSGEAVLSLIMEAVMVMLLYFYLYYQGRYLYNRVDVGIWLAVSLVIVWNYRPGNGKYSFIGGSVLAILALAVCVSQGNWDSRLRVKAKEDYSKMRTFIEELHSDQEHLYLTKMGTVSFAKAYDVFDVIPKGMADNLYPLGGWTANTPVYTEVLEKYGVTNPFQDMIGNEKVYLVDKEIDRTMEYLHTYYDADAEAEEVAVNGKTGIYQIK